MKKRSMGVYFLANDEVLDLAHAFLNSFRRFNPKIPLCLIPFDEHFSDVARLGDQYDFSVFSGRELFHSCDEISRKFHGRVLGAYRKLCLWEGIFDEFIYIDVDTVIISDLDFVFEFLAEFDFVTSHSNMPENRDMVWKPSIIGSEKLTAEQIEYAANTGFIASKRGALELEECEGKAEQALGLAEHMELFCMEQPFLNYLIVTSGKKYTSLFVLDYRSSEKHRGIKHELWAGTKGWQVIGGQLFRPGKQRHRIFMVHWAGKWRPGRIEELFYRVLARMGLVKSRKKLQVGYFIPYRKLWRYYRYPDLWN